MEISLRKFCLSTKVELQMLVLGQLVNALFRRVENFASKPEIKEARSGNFLLLFHIKKLLIAHFLVIEFLDILKSKLFFINKGEII